NHIYQFASVGEDCQDKKYAGEPTELIIGNNNIIRESVTIHRGTIQDKSVTQIGSNNLLMCYVHVAHDCVIGNNSILATSAILAGHVHIGGGAIVLADVPPYIMLGNDGRPRGINAEGLKRRGFDSDTILQIKRAYKVLYRQGLRAEEAAKKLLAMPGNKPEIQLLADFVDNCSRGIVR
ncbi:MAG: acyl-[acyl-carrier-protein]--UDP-N-acetylglucosamine O-acyltransferase, partial [Sinobacterium sp.]